MPQRSQEEVLAEQARLREELEALLADPVLSREFASKILSYSFAMCGNAREIGWAERQAKVDDVNDIVIEMQHERRNLVHDLKGIYAMLNNNRTLSNRRTPEEALRESEHVIDVACARLMEIISA